MTKLRGALVGAGLALALAVPTAGSASQAEVGTRAYGDCPRFTFCGWDGWNGTGLRMHWSGTIRCNDSKDLRPLGWANRISSIKNNTTAEIRLIDEDALIDFYSPPGNWGNLPWFSNVTDILIRNC